VYLLKREAVVPHKIFRAYIGGAENAGVENAGVENAGAIMNGKPKFEKTFNCIYSFQFKDSR